MKPAREEVITAIDFEGTGAVKGYADEPWQVGVVLIRDGHIDVSSCFEHLLYVGDRPFNRYAPGRHRALRSALQTSPSLPSLWPNLRPYLDGLPVVAHNVATEKRYLTKAFPLHVPRQWIDTLKLSKLAYPTLTSYKLEDVLHALGLIERWQHMLPHREAHDALFDAVGCAVLLAHLLEQPGWRNVTVDDLIALQNRKRRGSSR